MQTYKVPYKYYLKKLNFACAAIVFARRVFPVPGGPNSNTALHGFRFPNRGSKPSHSH